MKKFTGLLLLPFFACTNSDQKQELSLSATLAQGSWVDLTYSFSDETLYWPTADRFRFDTVFVYHNGAESYYAARGFRTWLKV